MSFCGEMAGIQDLIYEETLNPDLRAGSVEPTLGEEAPPMREGHKRAKYRKTQKARSTSIDSEKQEFYQKIKQSININFVDSNRYEKKI